MGEPSWVGVRQVGGGERGGELGVMEGVHCPRPDGQTESSDFIPGWIKSAEGRHEKDLPAQEL